MRTLHLEKRIEALEATQSRVPGDRWPPRDCNPNRRLARYASYFDGRPWECTGTPERKAQRDARLARYQDYFEDQETGVAASE
jgi:hypothetical protein